MIHPVRTLLYEFFVEPSHALLKGLTQHRRAAPELARIHVVTPQMCPPALGQLEKKLSPLMPLLVRDSADRKQN